MASAEAPLVNEPRLQTTVVVPEQVPDADVFAIGTYAVRYCGVLVPPPGAGVVTVMVNTPGIVSNDAGTCALSEVELANPVGCTVPFIEMTDALVNPLPVTVIVVGVFSGTAAGLIPVTVGKG